MLQTIQELLRERANGQNDQDAFTVILSTFTLEQMPLDSVDSSGNNFILTALGC